MAQSPLDSLFLCHFVSVSVYLGATVDREKLKMCVCVCACVC